MSADGNWTIFLSTPMGERQGSLTLAAAGDALTGTMTNEFGTLPIEDGEVEGDHLFWRVKAEQPFPMTLEFEIDVAGDALTGSVKLGPLGEAPVRGSRA